MSFELIKSETVLKGRVFEIRRDFVKTPDGRETRFDIVVHGGSVVLIPIDADGNLLFVRQYRHAASRDLLELPAGTLDHAEDPAVCASRELREETGFAADNLQEIGRFYLAPGYSTELMSVFIARDLRHDPLDADADEYLSLERVPLTRAFELAETGEIPDSKSLAALCLARPHLLP